MILKITHVLKARRDPSTRAERYNGVRATKDRRLEPTMRAATRAAWVLGLALAVPGLAGTPYGSGVTLDRSTPLEALLAAPEDHTGKAIRIDGVATEVCSRHGDWLKVSVPRGGSGILVLMDGDFAIPGDSVARRVAVQGVLMAAPLGDAVPAESAATADDPHVCAAMTRGGVRYLLRASGVVVD